MITRGVTSCIVGKAVLKTKEDISKTLKPYRVTKDNKDLSKPIDAIKNTMNPLDQNKDETLYCITTGASVTNDIKDDLLVFLIKGQELYAHFTEESFKDQTRFEKPISKRNIKNFASAAVKKTVTTKDQKVVELQGTRDLFGRLLYIYQRIGKIDIESLSISADSNPTCAGPCGWQHQ